MCVQAVSPSDCRLPGTDTPPPLPPAITDQPRVEASQCSIQPAYVYTALKRQMPGRALQGGDTPVPGRANSQVSSAGLHRAPAQHQMSLGMPGQWLAGGVCVHAHACPMFFTMTHADPVSGFGPPFTCLLALHCCLLERTCNHQSKIREETVIPCPCCSVS